MMDSMRDLDDPLLHQVVPLLEGHRFDLLSDLLAAEHEADVAVLLESLPVSQRLQVWEVVPSNRQGSVLLHLHDEVRSTLISQMPHHELVDVVENLDADDIAVILEDVSEERSDAILETLDQQTRADVEASLSYPEGSAGRLMRLDIIEVRADIDLYTVLRYLRMHKELPGHTDALMVVDESGLYMGKLPIAKIVTNRGGLMVRDLMEVDAQVVPVLTDESDVAHMFDQRDLISVAVVDDAGKLVGRITVDDVLDVIRSQSERAFMGMAGLNEEVDLFAPAMKSWQPRAIWLGLNLATASLAAWVIGQFEDSIAQIVALAILMPIVASMGGVAGSQTVTMTVRGLALGQVSLSNLRWLLKRELAVGLLNGLLWASVMGVAATLIFQPGIGVVIAVAMSINLLIAVSSGVLIPIVLDRFGLDPALSATMILMTITDVMGFLTFLGLATIFLL